MTMRERSDLFELFIAFPAAAATSVLRVRRQNTIECEINNYFSSVRQSRISKSKCLLMHARFRGKIC